MYGGASAYNGGQTAYDAGKTPMAFNNTPAYQPNGGQTPGAADWGANGGNTGAYPAPKSVYGNADWGNEPS